MNKVEIGSICYSTAGRDRGRYFIVVGMEDGFAYIADGKLRKIEKPKKKKLMHLKAMPQKAEMLALKLRENETVGNSDIRKGLMTPDMIDSKEG